MKKVFFLVTLIFVGLGLTCCQSNGSSSNSSGDEKIVEYQNACKEGDFEKAHAILDELHSDVGHNEDEYFAAADYIYKKEIATLLTSDGSEAEDKVVFLLSDMPLGGTKPNEGLIAYNGSGDLYARYVEEFNKLCDVTLTLSLNRKNLNLAQNVIGLYKEDLQIIGSRTKVNGVNVDGNHRFALFRNKSKSEAIKKYNEAIQTGRFGDDIPLLPEIEEDSVKIEEGYI